MAHDTPQKLQVTIREHPSDREPRRLLISSDFACRLFFTPCPHAQTLEAYSRILKRTVWIPLRCKQWSCHQCANHKITKLSNRTLAAVPNRLLTLTVDPSLWKSPRDAFDGTRRKVPEFVRKSRAKLGDFEYLRVTEITKTGWPHYHLLVRSPYMPHPLAKKIWEELTGAIIVDIRQVKDTFKSYHYLVKYLSKMHKIEWTARHVSYSKNFFPPEPPKQKDNLDLEDSSVFEAHPGNLAYHQYRGCHIVEIQPGVFTLDTSPETFWPDPKHHDYLKDPTSSLPIKHIPMPKQPPPPHTQKPLNQKLFWRHPPHAAEDP